MKKLLLIIFLFSGYFAGAQTVGQFRYDTTKFIKVGSRNHVMIDNLIQVTDSAYKPLVVGADGVIKRNTFWPGSGGGSVNINPLMDSVYRINDSTLRGKKYDGTTWDLSAATPRTYIYAYPTRVEGDSIIMGGRDSVVIYAHLTGSNLVLEQVGGDSVVIALPSGGGGTTKYTTNEYGILIDSATANLYKVRADSTVIASKTYVDNKDALKQNLVTLTTTGTSGAATFNQGTGALNIPQYSGGGGSTKTYAPNIIRNDSIYQRFNVLAYGAIPNDTLDDVPAIQTAINAAYVSGGGTVFFPNGVYYLKSPLVTNGGAGIGAPNSQIYLPYDSVFTRDKVTINIIGETPPNLLTSALVDYKINNSGVIIYSTITGTASFPSILGSYSSSATYDVNNVYLNIQNINFRVKANVGSGGPTMSALNLSKVGMINISNVLCDIDTASFKSSFPVSESVGIYTPLINNSAFCTINNTLVTGYRYGYVFSEHSTGSNNNSFLCNNAFVFGDGGAHASYFGRLGSYWCPNVITGKIGTLPSTGNKSRLKIDQLDIEWQIGYPANWFNQNYTIYDSTNNLYGDINYNMVQRVVGHNNAGFTKLGGANLNCNPLDSGLATRGDNYFNGIQTVNKKVSDTLVKFTQSSGSVFIGMIKRQNNLLFSNSTFGWGDPSGTTVSNGAVLGVYNAGGTAFSGIGTSAARDGVWGMWFQTAASLGSAGFQWWTGATERMSLTKNGNLLINTTTDITSSALTINSTTKGILIPKLTRTQATAIVGGIGTLTIVNAGSGGTNGTYGGTPITSITGSGVGGILNSTIAGNVVTLVSPGVSGYGYVVGDTLTATPGSVSGLRLVVATLNSTPGLQLYNTTSNSNNTYNGVNLAGDFISSSSATLTLQHGVDYVFTGSTSTWTLPAVSVTLLGRGNAIEIKNRGSGTITLNSNTGSTIYSTSSVGSINIVAGAACRLMPDGTYFNVQFNN